MASYEVEHNVPKSSTTEHSHPPRRPDLSTFFSTLEHVDTSDVSNGNALPVPGDVSAAYRTLAEAFERMRPYRSGDGPLDGMIELLVANSQAPPKEVKGVSQGFLDELERVPNKLLKPSMDCPICSNPFLDDEYPLVVRLPCNKNHMFDLECIAPWLKLHATCPLDRKDLVKEKEPPPPPKDEEEDGEWDDIRNIPQIRHQPSLLSPIAITTRTKPAYNPLPPHQTHPEYSPIPTPHPTMPPQSPFPTIDISPFLHPSAPPPHLHSTATHLSTACAFPGFFYLTHHNLPSALTDRVLALARAFFLHAPLVEKARLRRRDVGEGDGTGDGARGYQILGDNVTGGRRDWHEALDWYRPVRAGEPFEYHAGDAGGGGENGGILCNGDGDEERREGPYALLKGMNAWPRYPDGFRGVYEEYVERMLELGTAVVRAMGVALGGGMEDVFVGNTRESAWVMRAIGYPSLPEDDNGTTTATTTGRDEGGVSCGSHSDYGCVTILLADGTKGALQAWVEREGEEGGWVDVDPVEGALVVNIGDMMSRWSGGKWKATRHRVVHKGGGYRVSVPFFFEPDWNARVPGIKGEEEVIYGEYLEGKVKGNF